ncbi:MAG: DegT/DnrJ/EryC1/StrS family aminotransferase [Coxiellaceae bacterium]|jgi:perosamine synthetase|nr:DegT/DnrJ/EryC1/StrS family aminotransferase [Coxiellaceae bacterium]
MSEEPNKAVIPVYKPFLDGREINYVCKCLESNCISSRGQFIKLFEESFAKYLNAKYATTVTNGTVALHLALHTLGIKTGDEVIVPTLTYIATVNAIAYVGATPVFVDSRPDTWNVNVTQIESKITDKTKAILIVHLYGNPCAMDRVVGICKKYNLFLVEDVAEAFGSKYHEKYVGNFGDVSTFSFFGNKTITTGEGGMIVSKELAMHEKLTYIKSQAVSPDREYWHDEIGFNYRMTNICAAIGLAQLENADIILQKKQQLAEWYKHELDRCPVVFQYNEPDTVNTYWMVSILVKNKVIRDSLRAFLKQQGIETRPFFTPAHVMPVFASSHKFLVAESLGECGLNLPSYPALTKEDIMKICSVIKEYFKT